MSRTRSGFTSKDSTDNASDSSNDLIRDYPDVLDIHSMFALLKISTKTGYRLLHDGTIHAVKVDRSYRIIKENVLAYLGAKQDN